MSYVSPFTGDVVQPTDVSYRSFSMSADTTLSWPINGNTTGNYAARIMEVTPTTSGLKLYMPPANQTSVGTDSLIYNKGSYAINVVDSSGNAIVSVPAASIGSPNINVQYIYVTANATVGGTWGVIAFGTGSSTASPAALAGLGLVAISTTLNQSHPVSTISTSYSFSASDRAQVTQWTSGTGVATLPLASSVGNNWFVLFKNNGTGTFTISTTSPDLIDGASTKQFAPGNSAFIISTGTSYITVGYGQSNTFAYNILVKSVTGGAYTLTQADAANTIQEFVGTLVSNVTVTYPPVVNLYVISNQTTPNGHTLTVTTGITGGATATIPAGAQVTLICDGTNFLNANTVQAGATQISVIDGSAAVPSINFSSETTTGIYRPGTAQWGLSILGTNVITVSTSGIKVTGTGTFTGGIAGGTFT